MYINWKILHYYTFMKSHCLQRHYMFRGKSAHLRTVMCGPPRLPLEIFKGLHHLPDPVPRGEHYDDFDSLYGVETTENHRPSLHTQKMKGHGMPFSPSTQTARNVDLVIQCKECLKWRVVHSKRKLKPADKNNVIKEVEQLMYSCCSVFQDIDGYEDTFLSVVFVRRNLTYRDDIEVTYYGTGNENICVHCGTLEVYWNNRDTIPFAIAVRQLKRVLSVDGPKHFKPKTKTLFYIELVYIIFSSVLHFISVFKLGIINKEK